MDNKWINIFLASPSDTSRYRKRVADVIEELNNTLCSHLNIVLILKRWEKTVFSHIGESPQNEINRQTKHHEIDIFIGMLWGKFGSKTGNKNSKDIFYNSGTEEEFDIAYENYRNGKNSGIVFFKITAEKSDTQKTEVNKINRFFKKFSYDQQYEGLYKECNNLSEFDYQLRGSLINIIYKTILANQANAYLNPYLNKYGFKSFYWDGTNSMRDFNKQNTLIQDKEFKIISKTGLSFLDKDVKKFYPSVFKTLKNGGKFKFILLNPYSMNAFYTAFGEETDLTLYNNLLLRKLTGQQAIDAFERSYWYNQKIKKCIDAIVYFKDRGYNIDVRLVDIDTLSAIFISETCCYLEPYLNAVYEKREPKNLPMFEICVNRNNVVYKDSEEYFDELWKLGIDIDYFNKNKSKFESSIKDYINNNSNHNSIQLKI